LERCTQYNFLKRAKKRYCQKPPKNRSIVIRWNNPCLSMRFVSDHQIVRRGFLGIYRFHKSDYDDEYVPLPTIINSDSTYMQK
uniref:THAP-type domain-containing protein n=1 Tax=Echinostoma caproni TaxID=27848 RepID=A0A183B550_9TREM